MRGFKAVSGSRSRLGRKGQVRDGFNQLNAPYDAKVIGDYTGLTPPDLSCWEDIETCDSW